MQKKSSKNSNPINDIEIWDDFEEVDLSKKRYVSDEIRYKLSIASKGKKNPKKGWNKKTTKQVIKEFIEVHGDYYDYSKVVYEKNKIKVIIICREHGEFYQRPSSHLSGHGCIYCGNKRDSSKRDKIDHQVKLLLDKGYNKSSVARNLGIGRGHVYKSLERLSQKGKP